VAPLFVSLALLHAGLDLPGTPGKWNKNNKVEEKKYKKCKKKEKIIKEK